VGADVDSAALGAWIAEEVRHSLEGWVAAVLLWGCVAASSLVLGALLGLVRRWRHGPIGVVLGFGAGALISSVSFELVAEGFQLGGPLPLTLGIVAGALTFFLADRGVARLGHRLGGGAAGLPLALGALLDGIPEQAVLGIGMAQGQGVSVALLVAIFVSNLPEAIGSSTDMKVGGVRPRVIILLWVAVAAVCALATVGGYVVASVTAERFEGAVDGFAAGALLVMLVGSMIPEATAKAGEKTGLAAVLGFAVAAGLSAVS
jgi:ZIP family zinc transporter